MTGSEWLACDDPQAMLGCLRAQSYAGYIGPDGMVRESSYRKLRLFACACVRQVWHLLTDERSRHAVEVAERYADGATTEEERLKARDAAYRAVPNGPNFSLEDAVGVAIANDPARALQEHMGWLVTHIPPTLMAAMLREIVGNPFRSVKLPKCSSCDGKGGGWTGDNIQTPVDWWECDRCDGSGDYCPWLTPTVLALAQVAYDERPGRACGKCKGKKGWWRCNGCSGEWAGDVGPDCFVCGHPYLTRKTCPDCHGTGRIDDGALDPLTLAAVADALEEAGCDNEEILRHLRGWTMCGCEMERVYGVPRPRPRAGGQMLTCLACDDGWVRLRGPHVRGCWAIDLLLGKE